MERRLMVAAGAHDREFCPVRASVPELRDGMVARLYELDSGREVACQVGQGEAVWLLASLPRGTVRSYRLVIDGEAPPAPAGFGLRDRPGEALDFTVGGQLFTSYRYAATWARPYFHPVLGPGGRRVTRSYPMEDVEGESRDHPHHKGIWVAHGGVNGVDDWSEMPGHGRIVHQEFESLTSGPVCAEARERLDWVSAQGARVLSERRRLAVYNVPGEDRLLDVDVSLTATEGPVTFADTKEAGILSIRVASSMEGKRGGLIENGFGGKREASTWGRTAPWCHYSGPVEGEVLGIGVLDHPGNPRHPTNWHVRDYGLMTANCFGLHDFFPGKDRDGSLRLPAGETITFRYRVYVHRGDAAAGRMDERWSDFPTPPSVGVE